MHDFDFTADVVLVDGKPESKEGRGLSPNPRLIRLDPDLLERIERDREK